MSHSNRPAHSSNAHNSDSNEHNIVGVPFRQDEVRAWFDFIRSRYHSGGISESDCLVLLGEFLFWDMEGHITTIGSETGKWYQIEDNSWIEREPIGALVLPVKPEALGYLDLGLSETEPKTLEETLPPLSPVGANDARQCANCNAFLPERAHFCPNCSAPAEHREQREVSSPTQPSIVSPSQTVNNCLSCGADNKPQKRYCAKCGVPLANQPSTQSPIPPKMAFCTKCGSQLKLGNRFCTNCGHRV